MRIEPGPHSTRSKAIPVCQISFLSILTRFSKKKFYHSPNFPSARNKTHPRCFNLFFFFLLLMETDAGHNQSPSMGSGWDLISGSNTSGWELALVTAPSNNTQPPVESKMVCFRDQCSCVLLVKINPHIWNRRELGLTSYFRWKFYTRDHTSSNLSVELVANKPEIERKMSDSHG